MSDNADFGTLGRFRETAVERMPPDMKDAYGVARSGARPPKSWMVNPPLSKIIVLTEVYFQTASRLSNVGTDHGVCNQYPFLPVLAR